MSYATAIQALQEYTKVGLHTEIEGASPYRLIQMLMEGAVGRISKAKLSIKNKNISEKGEHISSAISIIGGLRDSLDHSADAQIAGNLDALYEYMGHRLLEANIHDDEVILTEVHGLLMQIKTAWDKIQDVSYETETVAPGLQNKAG